jgi:hypothetical protein
VHWIFTLGKKKEKSEPTFLGKYLGLGGLEGGHWDKEDSRCDLQSYPLLDPLCFFYCEGVFLLSLCFRGAVLSHLRSGDIPCPMDDVREYWKKVQHM